MPPPNVTIAQFFVRILIFLGPALFIWSMARAPLAAPTAWLTDVAVAAFFPSWATGIDMEGTYLILLTSFQVEHESGRMALLTPSAQVLNYSYGLPLLAALLLASEAKGWWWKMALGGLILTPLHVLGVCSSWLVSVAIHAHNTTHSVTGFTPAARNIIAVTYQFSTLVIPTLAPLMVWLFMEREFAALLVRQPKRKAAHYS